MLRLGLRSFSWMLAALAVCVPLALAVARFDLHLNVAAVLTGSMRPTYDPGDAVVTRPIRVDSIRPGMVVLAVPPGQSTPFAHRVVAVTRRGAITNVSTKGDANPRPDAWTDTFSSPTALQVVGVVPKLGYLIADAHRGATPTALPFAVAGLLMTAVASCFVLLTAPTPAPSLRA